MRIRVSLQFWDGGLTMARILEHHTKALLEAEGIPVPKGVAIDSCEALEAVEECLPFPWVLKALVPKGKKGKAGLIKKAPNQIAALQITSDILGLRMDGFEIKNVLIEEQIDIHKEIFVSITYDNRLRSPVMLLSPLGGIDVEELTQKHPDSVFRHNINIVEGFYTFQARSLCYEAGFTTEETKKISPVLVSLYRLFHRTDARILEINPLAMDGAGQVWAVGALLNVDDEALFRHPELKDIAAYGMERSLGNFTERERKVLEADMKKPGGGATRYTEFPDGDIAINVIGGGASLVVLDAIVNAGGKPANYSDLGPGKGIEDKWQALLDATLTRPGIRAVFSGGNIIGALDVSEFAKLIVHSLKEFGIDPQKIPVVARWAGLGENEARRLFEAVPGIHYYWSGVSIQAAAERVVEILKF